MKKIIFMCINMNVGGTEKALLSMVDELIEENYDISILMLEEYGDFLDSIPSGVQIKYIEGFSKIKPILNNPPIEVAKDLFRNGELIKGINIVGIHLICKMLGERSLYFKYILRGYKELKEEYDLAVAYAGPMDFITYFVLKKIKAKKKVQWIHFDITKIGFNLKFVNRFYSKFDKVFVVSKEGKEKLIEKVPSLKNNTEVFLNIVSEDKIKELSSNGSGFEDDFDGIRILTVGRLSKEKGQDLTIAVLARLKVDGYKVKWYCIGDGNARCEYEKLIKKYRLEKDYILLGEKTNPYPFMKMCDIYVQPSRYEGLCTTITEMKYLNKPIIFTDVNGAREQLTHEENGLIVKIDENDIYINVKKVLDNYNLKSKIEYNLKNENKNKNKNKNKNTDIIEKLLLDNDE